MLYADIIVDIPYVKLDRTFTYRVPQYIESDIIEGMRVLVPFGKGSKTIEGIVMRLSDEHSIDDNEIEIKEIQYLLGKEPVLSKNQISLVHWLRDKYICKYIDAIRTIIPSGLSVKTDKQVIRKKKIEKEGELFSYLNTKKTVSLSYLVDKFKKNIGIDKLKREINTLVKEEYIALDEVFRQNINIAYRKYVYIRFNDTDKAIKAVGNRAKKQSEIVEFLGKSSTNRFEYAELLKRFNTSSSVLNSIQDRGLIEIKEEEYHREAIKEKIDYYEKHTLNREQQNAYDLIANSDKNKFLLKGVTGSGKTEVYLQLIEKQLLEGKDAIVLVPEIALTPQTVERFAGRFGDQVAIYHSRLSVGERYDEWRKIKEGKVKIVVGARSAIFSPFKNLGIIIIDEQHENSYKSEVNPKYDTLEVARVVAEMNNAKSVLGSATPTVESYYKSLNGEYVLVELNNRVKNIQMPDVYTIDMREELLNGNKNIFSYELYNSMVDRLEKKEQTILFLNSRGFSRAVSCRECGYTVKCNSCDISMNYHMNKNIMICHYCGQTKSVPEKCPECGSGYIKHMGIGTQRVEAEVRKIFPNAKVARMDADTMSRKGSYEDIYMKMKDKEIDILIGTQMISKGLDFPDVTLVGVIMADISLQIPDYSSSERTFQLITQVAGRAGRSGAESKVVIQTYNPENYAILASEKMDYLGFYRDEIKIRKAFGYPPFKELIDITVSAKDEQLAIEESKYIYDLIDKAVSGNFIINNTEVLGPNMALIYRVRDRYRMKILVKTNKKEQNFVKEIIRNYLMIDKVERNSDIIVSVDVNPRTIL